MQSKVRWRTGNLPLSRYCASERPTEKTGHSIKQLSGRVRSAELARGKSNRKGAVAGSRPATPSRAVVALRLAIFHGTGEWRDAGDQIQVVDAWDRARQEAVLVRVSSAASARA